MSATLDSDSEAQPKAKKLKVLQKYLAEYEVKYPIVRKSNVGNTYAYCSICRSDFSIGHGGIGDIAKHIKTSKHTAKAAESGPFTLNIN